MKVLRDKTAAWIIETLRQLQSQSPSLASMRGVRGGQEWLVPFELTSPLSSGGNNAKLLRFDEASGTYVPDDNTVIAIHDSLGLGFAAPAGARGIAVCLGESGFQVIALAPSAPRPFRLVQTLSRGGSALAECVDALGQGTGEYAQVYDHPLGIFFGASGTPGIAAYDATLNRWQIIAIGCSEL
jgi:hypothetical protein